jgi:hypothetical protein
MVPVSLSVPPSAGSAFSVTSPTAVAETMVGASLLPVSVIATVAQLSVPFERRIA